MISFPINENGYSTDTVCFLRRRAEKFNKSLVKYVKKKHDYFLKNGSNVSTAEQTPTKSLTVSNKASPCKSSPKLSRENYKYLEQSTWHHEFKLEHIPIDHKTFKKPFIKSRRSQERLRAFVATPKSDRKVVKAMRLVYDHLSNQKSSVTIEELFDSGFILFPEEKNSNPLPQTIMPNSILNRRKFATNPSEPCKMLNKKTLNDLLFLLKSKFSEKKVSNFFFEDLVKDIKKKFKKNLSKNDFRSLLIYIASHSLGWVKIVSNGYGNILRRDK